MNKYLLILACSLLASPGFAQQQQVSVSTSQNFSLPVATATQSGLLSPQDWSAFNAKQNAFGFTPENVAKRNQANGYAGVDATGKLPWTQLSGIPTLQPVLGFTPENSANKNKANGYLGADANGMLPWTQISNVPTASATSTGCLTSQDWIAFSAKQAALGFVPENVAKKNALSGYAGLDATGLIPGNLLVWSHVSNVPNASATSRGVLLASDWATFNAKQAAIGYTPENVANRDQPKGYPSLDASGKILANELPVVSVFNEAYQVPSAVSAVYTLANSSVIAATVACYRKGLRLTMNADYSVAGNVVTFSTAPNVGDTFIFDYQHQ